MSPEAAAEKQWILWVSTGVLIGTMCSMICCARGLRKFPQNYIFLLVLTTCMGIIV